MPGPESVCDIFIVGGAIGLGSAQLPTASGAVVRTRRGVDGRRRGPSLEGRGWLVGGEPDITELVPGEEGKRGGERGGSELAIMKSLYETLLDVKE